MRSDGKRLVLTNGCFDLLHAGHVRYLEEARSLGDALVVALNDDESVRRLKGPNRPVNPQSDRAEVLGALESVDFVCLFPDDTALRVVRTIRPSVYVKGGDYPSDPTHSDFPPEGLEVLRDGGEVRILQLLPGRSTSGLLSRLAAEADPMG